MAVLVNDDEFVLSARYRLTRLLRASAKKTIIQPAPVHPPRKRRRRPSTISAPSSTSWPTRGVYAGEVVQGKRLLRNVPPSLRREKRVAAGQYRSLGVRRGLRREYAGPFRIRWSSAVGQDGLRCVFHATGHHSDLYVRSTKLAREEGRAELRFAQAGQGRHGRLPSLAARLLHDAERTGRAKSESHRPRSGQRKIPGTRKARPGDEWRSRRRDSGLRGLKHRRCRRW